MSVYKCGLCDEFKDADFHGCNEHPSDDRECVCDSCTEDYSCFNCGEYAANQRYCKITDQYFCEDCAP